jgi:molecular chaperone GrpE (heat shock protein)
MKIKNQYPNQNNSILKASIEEVKKSNLNIQEELAKLRELYVEKISKDEFQNKQFEILVDELQRYKTNFIFETTQKRVFLDLIGVYDHLEEVLKLNFSDMPKEDYVQHLSSFRKQIVQVLNNQGVELIESKGSRFDPKYQESVGVVSTEQQEEDQWIDLVSSQGFIFDKKKILRPQKVIVKKYSNQAKKEV